VDTELYHNPRAAVASRRARSQPPQPLQVTQSVYRATRASVPPRGVSPPPRPTLRKTREVVVVVAPRRASVSEVDFRKPVTAGWRYARAYYNPYAYPVNRYVPRRNYFIDAPRGVDTRSHYGLAYGSYGSSMIAPWYYNPYYRQSYRNYYDYPYYVPDSTEKISKARSSVRVLASPLPYKSKYARKVT
jgi:hypothetical protein